MFWSEKKNFHSSNLEEYVAQVKKGELRWLPWIFCVFPENSEKHKRIAAKALSEVLGLCSVEDIYKIDEQMRETTSVEWSIDWRALPAESLVSKRMSESEKRAVFVFASFHPNGHIREQAMQAMTKHEHVLPFILLRCNDWVYQVRQAALELLPLMLAHASEEEIAEALPLMEKLRRSERCEYDAILAQVVHSFRGNDRLIKLGLGSKDVRARKFCITTLGGLDQIDNAYLMEHIAREKDPFLRKIVVQTLLETNAGSADVAELSERFLHDKYPSNRMWALQYYDSNRAEEACEASIAMLMDQNAQVRGLARSIVCRNRAGFDIRRRYLENLPVNPAVGIYGLGEVGSCEDCALIETFLAENRVCVVRAAMTALMRLDAERYVSCITDMLASEQSGIVKTATLLLKKHENYELEKIWEIQKNASNENTKIKCATLLFLGGKWKSLLYTLGLLGSGYEKLERLCQIQLSRWIFSYNRSYAALSENDKQAVFALLEEKARFLKPETVKQITFAAR